MWVKICGINDRNIARQVAELRPDAIGLNFYSGTPRRVSVDVAAEIAGELPQEVEAVGLFVNHSVEEILSITQRCGIQTIQLHGDEPPDFSRELTGLKVIRAMRIGEEGLETAADYLKQCEQLGTAPDYCLVDARVKGKYGGTGETVSWEMLAEDYPREEWPPLILSGGLTAENVSEAVATCQPWGVDVASGVESSAGMKDIDLVARFIQQARAAATE